MKKVLVIILIGLGILFLVLFNYKTLKTSKQQETSFISEEKSGIKTYKESEGYKKTFVTFLEISKEEYESKRKEHYIVPTFQKLGALPEKVKREDNCFIFQNKDNTKPKLELCDYIPSDPLEEVKIKKYANPIYIDSINAYFISQSFYEGGKSYLLDAENPSILIDIFTVPIFSENKKYFFSQLSEDSPYSNDHGLEIWSVTDYNNIKGFSKIVYYSPTYFGSDITEAFWVDNEIYLKTYWMNYDSYLKATINEFPTNLPRG